MLTFKVLQYNRMSNLKIKYKGANQRHKIRRNDRMSKEFYICVKY